MTTLYLDVEVFNELDIKAVGTWRHASTGELLLVSWALDDEPVQVCRDAAAALRLAWSRADLVVSYGAYDRIALEHLAGLTRPLDQWACAMAKAFSMGLPGKLDLATRWVGIPGKKDSAAMRKFTRPCRPTKKHPHTRWLPEHDPEGWEQFIDYARQDTHAMRALWQGLPDWNYDAVERERWRMDQRMNDRGLPVDLDACRAAVALAEPEERELNRECRAITGLNLTQRDKLLAWMRERDEAVPDLRRETYTNHEADDPQVARVLWLKTQAGRATLAKYRKMLDVAHDGRARHQFQFNGAQRTLRWAGRDVQPQNLLRPVHRLDPKLIAEVLPVCNADLLKLAFGEDLPLLDILASGIRGAFEAPPGYEFGVGDLSQIEARMVLWLAGQWDRLEAFADPLRDPYTEQAEEVGSTSRQLGKVLVLACGFGMGAARFRATAWLMYGIEMTEEEAEEYVAGWRRSNPRVVRLWKLIDRAFREALAGRANVLRVADGRASLRFRRERVAGLPCVTIQLPTGHKLIYWQPRVVKQVDEDGETVGWKSSVLARDPRAGWKRMWGGFWTENIDQSLCRHILVPAMQRMERAGMPLVGTVHDEVLVLDRSENIDLGGIERELSRTPSWAPDLPLAAETHRTTRYTKA